MHCTQTAVHLLDPKRPCGDGCTAIRLRQRLIFASNTPPRLLCLMQEEEEEPVALALASPAKHLISPKPSFASPRTATAAGGDVDMDLTTEGERLGNFEIYEEDDDDAADMNEARGIKGGLRGMLNMASPSKKPAKGRQRLSLAVSCLDRQIVSCAYWRCHA